MAIKVEEYDDGFSFTEGGPLLVIDGDYIPYSIGSVCQKTVYEVYLGGRLKFTCQNKADVKDAKGNVKEKGLYSLMGLRDKRELDEKLATDPRWKRELEIKEEVTAEPEHYVKHTVNQVIKKLVEDTGASEMKLYLTFGKNNFRNHVATIQKYKANRSGVSRPIHYETIRKYLMEQYGATIAEGREAEDEVVEVTFPLFVDHFYDEELGWFDMTEEKKAEYGVIYVAKDKDVFQNPGWLLNPDQLKNAAPGEGFQCQWVDPLGEIRVKGSEMKPYGLRGLYAQMLKGDDIDNIPGIQGYGAKTIYKLLNHLTTEDELYEAVLQQWKDYALKFNAQWIARNAMFEKGLKTSDNRAEYNALVKKWMVKLAGIDEKLYSGYYVYYPWECYVEDEFGAPTPKLKAGVKGDRSQMMVATPAEALQEVATLLWIRHIPFNKDRPDTFRAPIGNFRKEWGL